ncbi:MAG: PAS domain-containing protein, partial [Hydrogenophaga sp.]|nr:PAS domain-containing protein [Hydrogenophaga sp.]
MRNGSPTPRSALTKETDFEATGTWSSARDFSGFHQLAQLAAQLGGCAAAVVLDTTQWPPMVLGVHGASGETAASAAQYCAGAFPDRSRETHVDDLGAQHERDDVAAGTEWASMRHAHWLPVAPMGGQSDLALLLLDPAAQPHQPTTGTTLTLLTAHAAEVLALWRRCEVSEQYNVNVLRESESRLNLTEHTAGAGSWSMQVSTGLVTHSDEFATILGLPDHRHVVSLDSMVQRYNPEWRSGIRQRLERCAVSGEGFDEEIQIMVEGGTPKWVRTVGTAVRNKDGNILRIQGAIQDISAQKQAQQDTLRLAMRLTTTLASITEAFVTLDRQCCFTYLNQESERLLQKTTADLLGEEVWKD